MNPFAPNSPPADAGDDLVLQRQRRRRDGVAEHRIDHLCFPQQAPGARVERHQRGIQRSEEHAISQHRHAPVETIDPVGLTTFCWR